VKAAASKAAPAKAAASKPVASKVVGRPGLKTAVKNGAHAKKAVPKAPAKLHKKLEPVKKSHPAKKPAPARKHR
jgi:DnaK suppressor protein